MTSNTYDTQAERREPALTDQPAQAELYKEALELVCLSDAEFSERVAKLADKLEAITKSSPE